MARRPRKPGRPKTHKPTPASRAVVQTFATCGVPHDEIARELDISVKVLRSTYEDELTMGGFRAIVKVYGNMFKIATQEKGGMPTVSAGLALLKMLGNRMGGAARWIDQHQITEQVGDTPQGSQQPVILVLPDNSRDQIISSTLPSQREPLMIEGHAEEVG